MKDCTTCKYGYEDERLGIPMCHHPKRFSEDCVNFNMHEEKESEHLAGVRKTSPKGLEEAAREYGFEEYRRRCNGGEYGTSEDAFIAGTKWQKEQDEKEEADLFTIVALDAAQRAKEQMVENALHGWLDEDNEPPYDLNVVCEEKIPFGKFKHGDKVRIIIVKED